MSKKNKQLKKDEAFKRSDESVVPQKPQQQQQPFRRDENMTNIKKGQQ